MRVGVTKVGLSFISGRFWMMAFACSMRVHVMCTVFMDRVYSHFNCSPVRTMAFGYKNVVTMYLLA